ncbi:MAG: biotin/lipoyl-containing protein [Deltaproteobacteria bacterium]|nr:biotin/lipoyl-containing protein [Deltaproteobacteria bacterium]
MIYHVTLEGNDHVIDVSEIEPNVYRVSVDGNERVVDAHATERTVYSLIIGGESIEANVVERQGGFQMTIEGDFYDLDVVDERRRVLNRAETAGGAGAADIKAQMPGKVLKVLVEPGQAVEVGQGVIVLEAMKMENEIKSPTTGTVKEVAVETGQAVESGQRLVLVE